MTVVGGRYPEESPTSQGPGVGRGDPDAQTRLSDARDKGREQLRGSVMLLLGRVLSLVFTVATQVVLVRALSKSDFGAFAYALTLVSAGRILLSLGQGRMLSRFMSIYEEERDYARMFGSMLLAVATIAVTGSLLIVTMMLLGEDIVAAALGDPNAASVLLILLFLAPMEALDQVFVSLFAVFSRARSIFFRKYLLTPGLRLLVVLALVIAGGDVTFLAFGYVATQLVGLLVYTALLRHFLRERGLLQEFRLRQTRIPFKAVLSFSFPTLTTELMSLSMNAGSVILLGIYRGAAEIAGYRAVFPAARLNQFIFASFVTLFLPTAARLYARRDQEGMGQIYWHTAVFLAVASFPVFAMTGIFAPATTVTLFGERYSDASIVLALLAAGYYFNVALGFNAYTLQVYGKLRQVVSVNVFAALVNVALCLLLIPQYGALGVAIANCSTLVVQNLLNQVLLSRTLGCRVLDRHYVMPYLLVLVAGLLLGTVQVLAQPGILVALACTMLVSTALLVLTRRWLELAETFPGLARVPVLRWLLH